MSNYRNSSSVDFDNLFEPETNGNGAEDSNFRLSNGTPMRYAALQHGTKGPDVNYRQQNGSDVSNLWAQKGSVSYLAPSTSFLSGISNSYNINTIMPLGSSGTPWNNNFGNSHGITTANGLVWDPNTVMTTLSGFGDGSVTSLPTTGCYFDIVAHGQGDTLTGSFTIHINADGTWSVVATGTNGTQDQTADGLVNNPSSGKTLASGNWLKFTTPGAGAGYNYSVVISNQKSGMAVPVGPNGSAQNNSSYRWNPPGTPASAYPNGRVDSSPNGYLYRTTAWNANYGSGPTTVLNGTTVANDNAAGTLVSSNGNLASDCAIVVSETITAAMANYNKGGDYQVYGEDDWYHRFYSVDLQFTITSTTTGASIVGQVCLVMGFHWFCGTYGGSNGGGGGGGGGTGCVMTESLVANSIGDSTTLAKNLTIGLPLLVTDPWTNENNTVEGKVLDSETELQPCVMCETEDSALLGFSTSAPIPTRDNGYQTADNLLGQYIPIAKREDIKPGQTAFKWSRVTKITDLGMQPVQRVYAENRCFWASADGVWFILHHNLKQVASSGTAL